MDRVVETRRVDSAECGQISSASHDKLTDRLWGGLDDRTDRVREPGDQQGAESMGRSVGNLVELTLGTSQGHVPRADPPSQF